jgi:hypothetical protein
MWRRILAIMIGVMAAAFLTALASTELETHEIHTVPTAQHESVGAVDVSARETPHGQ